MTTLRIDSPWCIRSKASLIFASGSSFVTISSRVAARSPTKLSSGPRKKCCGRSTRNARSSAILPTGAVEGRLILDDQVYDIANPDRLAPLRGRRIGLIPQEPGISLDPLFRVGDQLPTSTPTSARVTLERLGGQWLIAKFEPV